MTTIHVQHVGDKALLPRTELDQLIELARQHQGVAMEITEDDLPTLAIMRLAEQGGAFDFWLDSAEDVYSASDGEPV